MLSSGIPWNIPRITCVYQENTRDKWDIPWYTTRKRCITILFHAIENTVTNRINVAHDGKVGCNTVEYTTAFLYSDWLYFLWHGINTCIILCLLLSLRISLYHLHWLMCPCLCTRLWRGHVWAQTTTTGSTSSQRVRKTPSLYELTVHRIYDKFTILLRANVPTTYDNTKRFTAHILNTCRTHTNHILPNWKICQPHTNILPTIPHADYVPTTKGLPTTYRTPYRLHRKIYQPHTAGTLYWPYHRNT